MLALVRGGLPVAFEVARASSAPLDVVLARKIGAPSQPELAVGAAVDDDRPEIVTSPRIMRMLGVSRPYLDAEARRRLAEIDRRQALYRRGRRQVDVSGRTAIVVDDGGGTFLRAYRVSGHSHSREQGWKLFHLDEIGELKALDETFSGTRPGDMRHHPALLVFAHVIDRLPQFLISRIVGLRFQHLAALVVAGV